MVWGVLVKLKWLEDDLILMSQDPVAEVFSRLYELCVRKAGDRRGNRVKEGHMFEDETSQEIFLAARESGIEANSSRMILNLPTLSGNRHQFDGSFRHGDVNYVVECKNTSQAAKDYLYYFRSKIADYIDVSPGLDMRGVFLSTVAVAESAWRFGLAYRIRIIDPVSPPIEHMLNSKCDEALSASLNRTLMAINDPALGDLTPEQLLGEYRFLVGRWLDG